MSLHSVTANKLQILWLLFYVLISFTFILSHGAQAIATNGKVTKVAAIIDMNSPIGKQEKIAMEIAAQSFNKSSRGHKLFISFHDSAQDSLRAASLAEKILEKEKPNVIIGMETWSEAALVAKVGNEAQVPVISFTTPSITSSLMQLRWPFLITMQNHDSLQELNYIADLVCAYNWKKLVVIREDDKYSTDLGKFSHLNEVLQKVGSEIEYHLVLPPYSSLSNPKDVVLDQLVKLLKVQSRAFIVLQSSLPMMTHLFKEAKRLGLMKKDSVWIITESITSLLDFVDNSVLSTMEGVLGVRTYYSKNTTSYTNFHNHFQKMFQTMNIKKLDRNPGIYALRAYDSIITIRQAIEKMSDNNSSSKVLLENILASNFDGLSGKIQFKEGNLVENTLLRIVNVVGKKGYKELDFWKQGFGFFTKENGEKESSRNNGVVCKPSEGLNGSVIWPGNLESKRKPKGWAMPTDENPLRIGVPGKTSFKKFVKVNWPNNYSNEGYEGFCIQIFREVVKRLDYDLPYKFEAFNGTYPDLVDHVYWKTFDAVVGDITILANRTKYVEFTQPYAESGLSMVVPIKLEDSLWLFMKPFTWDTWVVTFFILFYTMAIVWFLEHPTNPKFNGSLKDQIGTSLWFTFSSLFFAHREKIRSNLTRVVVTMWLFVVLILSSSYTASLSSMLTVKQLEPLRDVEWFKRTNQKVGVDGDSFVLKYLQDVLDFKSSNIYKVVDEYSYGGDFANKTITAAFLELPYEKVFLNKYCKDFTTASPTFRFGGLGFAFQKGSPIARDVSAAILSLLEDGTITKLQKDCLTPSDECSDNIGSNKTESLSLESFWGIYLISGATSTFCFLISLTRLLNNFKHHQQANGDNQTPTNMSIWKKGAELAKYFYKGAVDSPGKASSINSARMPRNLEEWSSSRWEIISISDAPDQSQATTPPLEIDRATTPPLEIEVAYR